MEGSMTEMPIEPVRKRVRVKGPAAQAFETFTDGIGTWWPVTTHSITAGEDGSNPPQDVVVEPAVGGRVYEVAHDGRECEWGTLLAYEPPQRIVIEWRVNPAAPPTEVEVRFLPDGDGTLVELEHRGWERYVKEEEAAAARLSYDSGWPGVLERFTEAARD
jgi:uncharacterized protein YndB with AHSA1/START domain